jgi:hypothetical protein
MTTTPAAAEVTPPVVLIERDPTRIGGHWYRAALALAHAARAEHRRVVVVALGGIDAHARGELARAGAEVITEPARGAIGGRALHRLAGQATRLSAAARRAVRHRRFPHQITLLARCAAEAAALRTAADHARGAVPILLTASEALPGLTGLLGGPHLRIIHDVITTQDRSLRLLDRATRRWHDRAAVVCPTRAVCDALACEHPGLAVVIRPFGLLDHADRLSDGERVMARDRLNPGSGHRVVTLVGGWWAYKDIGTIDAALSQLTARPHLLVAGEPLDPGVLARWHTMLGDRLRVRHHSLTELQLREIYAATDLLLVARTPGTATESGLVCDAVRHGVPLVMSDHDPQLCARLGSAPWLRTFTAGDPASLARVLDAAIAAPPDRPDSDAPGLLGLSTPHHALQAFTDLHRSLVGTRPR